LTAFLLLRSWLPDSRIYAIRGDARFEEIVASGAPKEGPK